MVRVKVNRLKLVARLEEVRDEAKRKHAKDLADYERRQPDVRMKLATELRVKADSLEAGVDVLIGNDVIYGGEGRRRGERRTPTLSIESKVKVPKKPEPHRGLPAVERAIALLLTSDDETVSIGTDDMEKYGIGSLAGLPDD